VVAKKQFIIKEDKDKNTGHESKYNRFNRQDFHFIAEFLFGFLADVLKVFVRLRILGDTFADGKCFR
jgi:hypothetical protein